MKLNNGVEIKNYGKPYFIAELNTSHFGDLEIAKSMISIAGDTGVDCVKFQSWSADTLYSNTYYKQNPIAKRFVDKFSFTSEQLRVLAQHAKLCGVSFSSTPYAISEVDFLINECNVPFIKIASMEINNYSYLEYVARTGSAIILSTGMADQAEINRAVQCIFDAGNKNLCVLHCVSIYPAEPLTINLNNIVTFRSKFDGVPIGYSDHTIGTEVPIAAVVLGSPVIEKHFTLDSKKIGMDNQMAMEPSDFKAMIKSCNVAWQSLGAFERVVSEEDHKQRMNMRRSIVSKVRIPAGAKIELEHIDFKRPGNGISPEDVSLVVGKRAIQDIPPDEIIFQNMINRD
jgi:sialic acid synthase SpsE